MNDQIKMTKAELLVEVAALRERETALEGQVHRLEAIHAAIKGLNEVMDLEAVEPILKEYLKDHVSFDRFSVALVVDERHFEHLGTGEVVVAPGLIGDAGSATDWVIKNKRSLIRQDILVDTRFRVSERTRATGIRSDILLPLISRNEVIGTLSLASNKVGVYSEKDQLLLEPLADQVAVIADRARLYRDLRAAYRDLKLIYDRVSDLIVLFKVEKDGTCRYASVNQACLQAVDLPENEIIGKRVEDVLPLATAQFVGGKHREAIQKGTQIHYEGHADLPGGYVRFHTTITPILDKDGVCTFLLGVIHNLAEREQAEQEIIRLERLHALEEMARGVAHNFNNILVGVLGYAQLIEMQSRDAQAVENAKQIVESALRAKDLVQRLNLSVGRGGDSPPQQVNGLEQLVREAIEATSPRWKDEAEARGIVIEMDAVLQDVPAIRADRMGLHHVLVHLISNAVDALPEGGRITVATRPNLEYVELDVADNGVGMTEETQKRIYDPFFTTKQDVGSGLGLSMAYRTIMEWGGQIELESAPGKGSRFKVLLPVWNPSMGEESSGESVGDLSALGRVMVVDDEWTIRQVLVKALRGYPMDTYTNGKRAVEKFRTGVYAVALIDLGIPGLPGDEVARQIKAADPEVVTVLITGWEIMEGDPRLEPFDHHVQKPFGLAEIQRLVARAMEKSKV